MEPEWMTTQEVANEVRVPVRTVYSWRASRHGPRAAKFGKHIRYRRTDVEAWIRERLDGTEPTGDQS